MARHLIPAVLLTACVAPPGDVAGPVVVTGTDLAITASGAIAAPRDLSGLRAYGFTGDGEAVELTVADGVIQPGSPGLVYLDAGDLWIATERSELEIGRVSLGRSDVAVAAEPTTVALGVDGLSPWQQADRLQLYSAETGAWLLTPVPDLPAGSTELDVALDYRGPLIEAGRGDRVWLAQLAADAIGDDSYAALARAVELDDVDLTAPSPSVVAALADAPVAGVEVDWRISRFDQVRFAEQQIIASSWYDANVASLVAADEHGFYGVAADLVTMRVTDQTGRDIAGRFAYADPFPAGWTSMSTFIAWYPVAVRVDPADVAATLFDNIWIRDHSERLDGAVVEPWISAPRSIEVGGRDAREPQRGVGRTPIVRWQPPALGEAAGYRVVVVSLESGFGVTREIARVTVATASTEIRIPPGAVEANAAAFAVQVVAVAGPENLGYRPYRLSLPYAVASLTSAALVP